MLKLVFCVRRSVQSVWAYIPNPICELVQITYANANLQHFMKLALQRKLSTSWFDVVCVCVFGQINLCCSTRCVHCHGMLNVFLFIPSKQGAKSECSPSTHQTHAASMCPSFHPSGAQSQNAVPLNAPNTCCFDVPEMTNLHPARRFPNFVLMCCPHMCVCVHHSNQNELSM